MNRMKKYVREKGIKLEADYPWMPYEVNGVFLRGVDVGYSTYHHSIVINHYWSGGVTDTLVNSKGVITTL